ncbi:MAG: hypothetical protein ACTSQB_00715, partial [Candidatus Heimdallarchaeota archaeon]
MSKQNSKDRILRFREEIKIITNDFTNKTASDRSAVINRLIFLINDEDAKVRGELVESMSKLGTVEDVQAL